MKSTALSTVLAFSLCFFPGAAGVYLCGEEQAVVTTDDLLDCEGY